MTGLGSGMWVRHMMGQGPWQGVRHSKLGVRLMGQAQGGRGRQAGGENSKPGVKRGVKGVRHRVKHGWRHGVGHWDRRSRGRRGGRGCGGGRAGVEPWQA